MLFPTTLNRRGFLSRLAVMTIIACVLSQASWFPVRAEPYDVMAVLYGASFAATSIALQVALSAAGIFLLYRWSIARMADVRGEETAKPRVVDALAVALTLAVILALAQNNLPFTYANDPVFISIAVSALLLAWMAVQPPSGSGTHPVLRYTWFVVLALLLTGCGDYIRFNYDDPGAARFAQAACQGVTMDMQQVRADVENAAKGDAEAQFRHARRLYAYGGKRDYPAAAAWYRKAAEQGHAQAQYEIGIMTAEGEGVEADRHAAFEWYRKGAAQHNADAETSLEVAYHFGWGVTADTSEYMRLGAASALARTPLRLLAPGGVLDAATAARVRAEADKGDATVQYDMYLMYSNGSGVAPDEKQSVEWLARAAQAGYAPAQEALGSLSMEGLSSLPKDRIKGFELLEKAAAQGYPRAQRVLGAYLELDKTGPDPAKAAELYLAAAQAGNADASFALGRLYDEGRGVKQDYRQAFLWFVRTARNPDSDLWIGLPPRCTSAADHIAVSDLPAAISDAEKWSAVKPAKWPE